MIVNKAKLRIILVILGIGDVIVRSTQPGKNRDYHIAGLFPPPTLSFLLNSLLYNPESHLRWKWFLNLFFRSILDMKYKNIGKNRVEWGRWNTSFLMNKFQSGTNTVLCR